MRKLLYAIPLVLIFGCTKKVDSNDLKDEVPYYQNYEVAYDKTANVTSATAMFNVRTGSGAKVQLSGSGSIKVNGMAPGISSIDPTRYTWNISGLQGVNFVLQKGNGQTITNTINKTDIGDIEFAAGFPDSISKSKGLSFSWTGGNIVSGETFIVSIVSPVDISYTFKDVTGNTVQFSAAELQDVQSGQVYIQLSRTRNFPLDMQDGTSGGGIQVRLYSKKKAMLN